MLIKHAENEVVIRKILQGGVSLQFLTGGPGRIPGRKYWLNVVFSERQTVLTIVERVIGK